MTKLKVMTSYEEQEYKATKVINLTQHNATEEQLNAGVIEPNAKHKEQIKKLLTFNEIPNKQELFNRAEEITSIAQEYEVNHALIGGAPYFMRELAASLALHPQSITPLYSFTKRISEEKGNIKTSTFKHVGFIIA